MTESLIALDRLAVEIQGREILTDVSWQVQRRQVLGLVGETGSGKTMCLRALTGTLYRIGGRVSGGQILFDGECINALPESRWRRLRGHRVALIPQNSMASLNPLIRVGRQLTETIRMLDPRRRPLTRATELLEQVEIHEPQRVLRLYPHELSGGMRQRVMIAFALAGQPDVLVADEPTTALDVTVQRRILELFLRLRDGDITIVLVTHDLGVAETVSDVMTVMYAGMTVESGTTDAVFSRPRHPYTKALMQARPRLSDLSDEDGMLGAIPGAPPAPEAWPSGCRFAPRCRYAKSECDEVLPELIELGNSRVACIREEARR